MCASFYNVPELRLLSLARQFFDKLENFVYYVIHHDDEQSVQNRIRDSNITKRTQYPIKN